MGEVFFSQLIAQTPVLVVYLVGLTVALIYLSKAPAPAILTLIACAILLLVSIGQAFAQARLTLAAPEMRLSARDYGRIAMIIAVVASLLRALAFACLLAAAFIGRRQRNAAAM